MSRSFLPPPMKLSQEFQEDSPREGGVQRRTFIKRTGGATLATALAWNLATTQARAGNTDGSSGSWWTGSAVFTLPLEVDLDSVITQIRSMTTTNPATGTTVPVSSLYSGGTLRSWFGWAAGQKWQKTLVQLVTWEEKLSKTDGTGDAPTKFRNLAWIYEGNKMVNLTFTNTPTLAVSNHMGAIFSIEGFFPGDTWNLGSCTINASSGAIVAPNPYGHQWYPSNNMSSLQTNDKAVAAFGNYPQNGSAQPQSLKATGNWEGTNVGKDGVATLELTHATTVMAQFYGVLPGGQQIALVATGLSLAVSQTATVVTRDWQFDRAPYSKNGTFNPPGPYSPAGLSAGYWLVKIVRPGTTAE